MSRVAVQGYHDEFLSHKLEFSESWREAAEEMNRTGPAASATSDRGRGSPVDAALVGAAVTQVPTSPMRRVAAPAPSGDAGSGGGTGGASGGGVGVKGVANRARRVDNSPALMDADEEVGPRVDSETEALMEETRLHLAV